MTRWISGTSAEHGIAESGATLIWAAARASIALNCGGSPLRPGIAWPRQVPIAVGTMGIPIKRKARREP